MDVQEVLAHYDREQRREIEFPDMKKQVLPGIVRYVRPLPGMSFVLYSALDEAQAEAPMHQPTAYLRANDPPLEG